MKKIFLAAFTLGLLSVFSQSDNCSTAGTLAVNTSCVGTAGTTAGATQSIPGCSGAADDDVWYKFTATGTSHVVTVNSSATFDAVAQMFSGTCGSLTSLFCQDVNFSGQSETIYATGLTAGNTYFIRVYHYGTGSASSTFTICVTTPPAAPANNSCFTPTALTVNASCVNTAGTSYGATQSYTSTCGGTPDDDVWYTFVANNAQQVITVTPSGSMDPVFEVLSGSCGAFTSLYCVDNTLSGSVETVTAAGLTPGQTYYVRVFDYYGGNGGYPFQICVSGNAGTGDNPCNAYVLPSVDSDCNYMQFSNNSATATGVGLAPTPASCGGSSPFQGGFSASSHDVWFSVVVPSTGSIYVTPQPNMGTGSITDGVLAIYSGACGSLTQIACNDDHNYPGSANDLQPYIAATGLTPGATVYIRYWGYGSSTGNFGICVSSPTNDACANALYICDLNGYSASTSAAYTPDRPCNMRGDNEDLAGNDIPDGTSVASGGYPAGIFGLGGSWGTGQPGTGIYDVNINNNSWIKFTAAAATATFSVSVGNCWVGNYPSGGIQMQIFSGTNCCNFIPVSDFKESSTGFTLSANGLTAGQTYYLMIDGFAGDICNYTIKANSGVLFPGITAAPSSVCYGDSTTLTGPAGATSYQWAPGGQTTQTVVVAPPSTMTYTCIAGGICGYKQTLTKTITVNPKPTILINGAATSSLTACTASTLTLTASGGTNYSWSTGQTTSTISVGPPAAGATTVYTITGTDANGCQNTATLSVTGLPLPTFTLSNSNPSVCFGQSVTITAGPGTLTYSWSTGASVQTITVSPSGNTSYTATATDGNGCKSSLVANVTVLQLPTITTTSATICAGQTATVTASGGSTYSWSNAQTGGSISVSPGSTTNYTVTGTGANTCTNTAVASVTVNQLPNVTVNSGVVCSGTGTTLNAGGATTYSWSNSQSGPSISVTPTTTTSYTVTGIDGNNCSASAVATVTVNPVPVLAGTPSVTPSNCGGSTGAITGVSVTGSGTLTYTWTNSSNVVVGNSPNLNNQPAGVYNLSVTDQNGCSSTFGPFSITNPGAPSAPTVVANDTTVCEGQTIILTASSSTPGATFTWTGPGLTSTSPTVTLSPAQVNQSGIYAVTASAAGCTGPAQNINVTVYALPVVSAASQSNSYCSGSSIGLFGSGGGTYSWTGPGSFSSTQQNPSIPNSTSANAGTYTLVVTDANGCVNTDTAQVIINQTPSVTGISAANTTICEGQSIQLSATSNPPGATFSWTGPNGFSSSLQNNTIPNASVVQGGTYSVSVNANGCTSATATVVVLVNPNPTAVAVASNTLICSGNSIVLTGAGGGTYSWNGPGGFSSTSQNNTINNAQVTAAGTYTLVVTNGFNCTDTAATTVAINPTPTVSISSAGATICEGQPFQLNANATPAGSSFSWSGPGAYSSNQANNTIPNASPAQGGVYTVNATLNGCASTSATVSIVVNANPTASAAISNTVICSGNNVNLSGGGNGTYSWSGPGGFTSNQQNVSMANVPAAGSGTYTLVVTNTSNCTDTATVSLTVNQTPAAPITTGGSTCTGDTLVLLANGAPTINWYSDAALTNLVLANSPTLTPTAFGSQVYYVTSTSSNGCVSSTATVSASYYNLQAGAGADVYTGYAPLQVNFSSTVAGATNPSFNWTFGDNNTAGIQNPSNTYNNGGSFTVTLIVTDVNGCIDTVLLNIKIEEDMLVIIPNIFTPNSDDINDIFTPTIRGAKSAEGIIFNRWGQLVYSWNSLVASWDGKMNNGNPATDGTYFYIIKVTSLKGVTKEYTGPLTLTR